MFTVSFTLWNNKTTVVDLDQDLPKLKKTENFYFWQRCGRLSRIYHSIRVRNSISKRTSLTLQANPRVKDTLSIAFRKWAGANSNLVRYSCGGRRAPSKNGRRHKVPDCWKHPVPVPAILNTWFMPCNTLKISDFSCYEFVKRRLCAGFAKFMNHPRNI